MAEKDPFQKMLEVAISYFVSGKKRGMLKFNLEDQSTTRRVFASFIWTYHSSLPIPGFNTAQLPKVIGI
jgi:hypothetical protein